MNTAAPISGFAGSRLTRLTRLTAPLLACCATAALAAQELDPELLAGLRARSIGPAAMSGRIGAVASVPGDPTTLWAGAASGGLWKSTDGGVRFEPVFDDQDCMSIGAIAIDPRAPEVVWVGTGEGNPRNSASVGRGVYRTRDGGRTWQRLGLEHTERIHRIVLHPDDPDTAFVAALGTSWGESEQRGLYRTTDGGATWQQVLFIDQRTGCCDVVMDPHNPDKLFCGMWQHRRWPHRFESGGPGSGLYRSVDGGDSWQRIAPHEGIPKGELGRSCFQISRSDPRVVYALVEAERSALLRSDDGGFRWRTVNQQPGIAPRPFYFCDIRTDPQDPDRVYNLHTVIDLSTDGGRSFDTLVGWSQAHPDHHAMWIDPTAPERIVIGNDGGVYQSADRGRTWRHCANLPLAQFYHVAVDDDLPYHVYGGLQDNGSWRGPSMVAENGGIRNLHWQEVNFGDGFATLPDPDDSLQGYAMSQGGGLVRYDLRTGRHKRIRPPSPDPEVELRFNWNAAIAQDPFDTDTIYYGSQFVHRSPDRGESWTAISPDLTTDNPDWQQQDTSGGLTVDVTAAENYCSILTIAPSPVQQGVLWAGTDDGRVHVTQDGGATWTSVEQAIPDLPEHTWCPHIEASRFRAGTAYAVFDDHRRANWTPYVYRTDDFGRSWRSIAGDALDGYALCIEQDHVREDLLFVGTEFGLWFSIDGGAGWHRFEHGVPACSAMALVVHPTQGDLVVGTHGRGIFIVDDITPLRTLQPATLQQNLHVFPAQPAWMWHIGQTQGARFPGQDEFRGDNRAVGVLLHVVTTAEELEHPDEAVQRAREAEQATAAEAAAPEDAGEGQTEQAAPDEAGRDDDPDAADDEAAEDDDGPPKDQVEVEIRDGDDRVVRTFRAPVKLGLNRIVWRFERDGQPRPSRELQLEPPEVPPPGRDVLPGRYTALVRFQGAEQRTEVEVRADPRVDVDLDGWRRKDALLDERDAALQQLRQATQRLLRGKEQLALLDQRLRLEPEPEQGDDPLQAVRDAAKAAREALQETERQLWGKEVSQGIARDDGLISRIWRELGAITSAPEAPNATEQLGLERARPLIEQARTAVDALLDGPVAALREAVAESGLGLLDGGG